MISIKKFVNDTQPDTLLIIVFSLPKLNIAKLINYRWFLHIFGTKHIELISEIILSFNWQKNGHSSSYVTILETFNYPNVRNSIEIFKEHSNCQLWNLGTLTISSGSDYLYSTGPHSGIHTAIRRRRKPSKTCPS